MCIKTYEKEQYVYHFLSKRTSWEHFSNIKKRLDVSQ